MKTHSRFTRIVLAGGIIAASGGAALGLTGIASASLSGPSPAQSEAMPADLAQIHHAAGDIGKGPKFVSDTLAEALGMTVEELHDAVRSGKSIAQIANDQGKSLDAVKLVMIAEFSAHLDEHVAERKITREQADARLAKFTERLDEIVNRTKPEGPGRGGRRMGAIKEASEELASVLNLTQDELRTQLRSGKSLAEIAEAQDVDVDDVKKVLTDEFSVHLDEHVAEGTITREQADARLAKFTERLDDMVNKSLPEAGRHGGRRGHGGPGAHGAPGDHGMGPEGEMPGDGPDAPEMEGTGLPA